MRMSYQIDYRYYNVNCLNKSWSNFLVISRVFCFHFLIYRWLSIQTDRQIYWNMLSIKLSFIVFSILFVVLITETDARSLSLSQKELQSIGSVMMTALSHHITDKANHKVFGTFILEENENDFDISIDVDIGYSETHNGELSGKVLDNLSVRSAKL